MSLDFFSPPAEHGPSTLVFAERVLLPASTFLHCFAVAIYVERRNYP